MLRQIEIFARDARYAVRGLRKSPLFTAGALLALAIGVGSGTAVFSVVDRILFRSLPYADGDRLVSVGMTAPIAPQEFLLGYDYLDWRGRQTPFASMGYWSGVRDCDLTEANPVRLRCGYVSASLLPTLGVAPLAGRNFRPEENLPNAPKAALISYGLWRSRYGGDSGVVGRSVPLDGQAVTLAGVLPRGFELPDLSPADVLIPQMLDEAEQRTRRTATLLWTVARLKPGVSETEAAAALGPVFEQSMRDVPPAFRKDVHLRVRSLRDRQVRDARLASWILLGAVAAVLLIACANVANLLLARAVAREGEFAIRSALGAGRGRLVRQALTESTILALAGGAAGCALAAGLLRVFVAIAPEGIPRLAQASVDRRVLAAALAASAICGILAGAVPAIRSARTDALGGRRVAGTRHLFRHLLLAGQIAVSLTLLTGAGLLVRTLWNLESQPLGIRAANVLTAAVTLGQKPYTEPARRTEFFHELENRLRRIPGVSVAALTDSLPPGANPAGAMIYGAIDVPGRPRTTDGTGGPVSWRMVTPGYFEALGIPIVRGRAFTEEDRDPNRHVIIVSDLLARRMFPGEDAIGKQMKPGRVGPWLTVVGVAANVRNTGLAEADNPEYYVVRGAAHAGRSAVAVVRGTLHPAALAGMVRETVAALDPTLPVSVETFGQRARRLSQPARFHAALLTLFAGFGLLLAAIGLYGVMSFLVTQRTREIGVRMAMGATPASIARLVLGHAAAWTAAGAAAGIAGSLGALRLLEALLFQVSARDPASLGAAAGVLGLVALVAAWLPARRSARFDPVRALRHE